MSWSRTHRYWDAVHEAIEEIEHHPEQGLPWNPHLAEVFGTRRTLLDALRYRWNVLVQAQDDSLLAELEERHASMLRVIATAAAEPRVQEANPARRTIAEATAAVRAAAESPAQQLNSVIGNGAVVRVPAVEPASRPLNPVRRAIA